MCFLDQESSGGALKGIYKIFLSVDKRSLISFFPNYISFFSFSYCLPINWSTILTKSEKMYTLSCCSFWQKYFDFFWPFNRMLAIGLMDIEFILLRSLSLVLVLAGLLSRWDDRFLFKESFMYLRRLHDFYSWIYFYNLLILNSCICLCWTMPVSLAWFQYDHNE